MTLLNIRSFGANDLVRMKLGTNRREKAEAARELPRRRRQD